MFLPSKLSKGKSINKEVLKSLLFLVCVDIDFCIFCCDLGLSRFVF